MTLKERAALLTDMYPLTTFTTNHIQREFARRKIRKKKVVFIKPLSIKNYVENPPKYIANQLAIKKMILDDAELIFGDEMSVVYHHVQTVAYS